jgi:hypothetical protein
MVNAFSFCLYGPENPRYYPGMLENIDLVRAYFPSWVVYVYVAPDVDPAMVGRLKECSNVRLRETGVTGVINMIHRFTAIDEADVDLMLVRDADSRIHWKDRWAIREFVRQPQFVAHTIRDHIEHTASMMGGLWGLRKSAGINIKADYSTYLEDMSRGSRHAHDQNFLSDVIYPKVVDRMLAHYSNDRRRIRGTSVEFPFSWTDDVYCGRIECDFRDTPQPPPKSIFMEPPVFSTRRLPDTYVPPIVKFLARK